MICISSAYMGEEDKIKASALGVTNFIDKPISMTKLD